MAGIKWVLASDIDGTLVGHGGESALVNFLNERPEIGLVYLTGRTRANAEMLLDSYQFPHPLALATDIGADIFWGPSLRVDETWAFQQRREWSPRRIMRALEQVDGAFFQARCSYWRIAYGMRDLDALAHARAQLVRQGIPCRTLWDEEQRRMDVVPRNALKGKALKYILSRLSIRPQQCFVAGDGENDCDLLSGRYRGVVVANGVLPFKEHLPSQIIRSPLEGAQGVLDGLRHFLDEPRVLQAEFAG